MPAAELEQLAALLDPAWLARQVGLEPDAWQAELLRSKRRQIILNCSRQAGKSATCGVLALHEAIYHPPALVLLLARAERQSKELLRTVRGMATKLKFAATEVEAESTIALEFDNGSRIIALPGREDTVRGYSGVRLLVVDEASRVPDALYYAIRPMVSVSGGRLVLLSTPFGKLGFFHEVWAEGGADWWRVKITADQVPRISAEFLEQERRSLPDWVFRQEYFASFEETEDAVFSSWEIESMFSQHVEPLVLLHRAAERRSNSTDLDEDHDGVSALFDTPVEPLVVPERSWPI